MKPTKRSGVRQTSLQAYYSTNFNQSTQRVYNMMVLLAKKYGGDCTDMEIRLASGLDINQVTARRNWLLKFGYIIESRVRPSYLGESNRNHQAWKVIK